MFLIVLGIIAVTGVVILLEKSASASCGQDCNGNNDTTSGGNVVVSIPTTDNSIDLSLPLPCGYCMLTPDNITNDPNSWPTGNKIWDVCRAIANAEGAYTFNSNPDRLNNPGDISDGKDTYGSEHHSGSDITVFPDKQTGWGALYRKIYNAASGKSSVYKSSMTWEEIGQKWAPPNWRVWSKNVADYLGVSSTDTLGSYVNS